MSISAVSLPPVAQPQQFQNVHKPVAQNATPAAPAGGDSDGDNDGSGINIVA